MSKIFRLPQHVFYRRTSDNYLFLDTAKDKYFMLPDAQSRWFAEICERNGNKPLSQAAANFAHSLIQKDILRTDPVGSKVLGEILYVPPLLSAYDPGTEANPTLSVTKVLIFVRALVSALFVRKQSRAGVDKAIKAVKVWKSVLPPQQTDRMGCVRKSTASFHALTPFFFTIHNECFFRSLCLIRYLSLQGLSVDWVFGVRLCPFTAHCWVEYDHVILNEDYDVTLEFKPIMVV